MANRERKIHLIVVLLIFSSIPSFEALKCSGGDPCPGNDTICHVKMTVTFGMPKDPASTFTYGCTPPISASDDRSQFDSVARYFVLTKDGHLYIYGQCRGEMCNEPDRALDRNMRRQFDSIKKKCPSALVQRDTYPDTLAPLRCHSTDNADCACDTQQSLSGSKDSAWCFRRGRSTGCCISSNDNCRWRNGDSLPSWFKHLEQSQDNLNLIKLTVMVVGIFNERDRIDSHYVLCRDKPKECNVDHRVVRNFVQEICRVLDAEMETVVVARWWYVFVPSFVVALLLMLGTFSIVKRWNVRILIQ